MMKREPMFEDYRPIDFDCQIPIDQFRTYVETGCFDECDGFGYYATDDKVSNVPINFNEVEEGEYPYWATYAIWFNK